MIRRVADTISSVYPDLRGLHVRPIIQVMPGFIRLLSFLIFLSTSVATAPGFRVLAASQGNPDAHLQLVNHRERSLAIFVDPDHARLIPNPGR